MAFLPLPYILLEILAFTTFLHFYDFWDVFLGYLLPSIAGFLLLTSVGKEMLSTLQTGFQQGQMPNNRVLQRGAVLLGSIFLIIPLFFTRVIAVFLILPGLRHLSVWIFKTYIFRKIANRPINFVRFGGGFGPGGFRAGGFQTGTQGFDFGEEPRQERDAEVVNVTPIEITHTKINPPTEKK